MSPFINIWGTCFPCPIGIDAPGLVTISGCAPYAAVDVRRPSFSGRHRSSLEQFATPRHVCTVTACFPQSSEDLSLQTQFSLTILLCPRCDTCHYGDINRSYLLTQLTKYPLMGYVLQAVRINSEISLEMFSSFLHSRYNHATRLSRVHGQRWNSSRNVCQCG